MRENLVDSLDAHHKGQLGLIGHVEVAHLLGLTLQRQQLLLLLAIGDQVLLGTLEDFRLLGLGFLRGFFNFTSPNFLFSPNLNPVGLVLELPGAYGCPDLATLQHSLGHSGQLLLVGPEKFGFFAFFIGNG